MVDTATGPSTGPRNRSPPCKTRPFTTSVEIPIKPFNAEQKRILRTDATQLCAGGPRRKARRVEPRLLLRLKRLQRLSQSRQNRQ